MCIAKYVLICIVILFYNFRINIGCKHFAIFIIILFLIIKLFFNMFGAQMVKRLPTVQENWVWSLGQEDHLEKEMATHSSIFAMDGEIPWMENLGRLQSMGSQRVRHCWVTSLSFLFSKYMWFFSLAFCYCFLSALGQRAWFLLHQLF